MFGDTADSWLSRTELSIVPTGPVEGTLEAPSSKSMTNRLLVIAALAEGASLLGDVLVSDDTLAMISGLRALGARIERAGAQVQVVGTAGLVGPGETEIDAGLSGTTLRFLSAVALLAKRTVVIDGASPSVDARSQLWSTPCAGWERTCRPMAASHP
jgi:5-enolpyruvylshikimate-3-phosphate synthase